jgi:hypothetical protein
MFESTGVYGIDDIKTNCKGEGHPPAGYYYNNLLRQGTPQQGKSIRKAFEKF